MNFNHEYAFPQHPPDHPLWRDVNFCPPEVYSKLIQPLTMQTANKANKGKKGKDSKKALATLPPVLPTNIYDDEKGQQSSTSWSSEDDRLLIYQQSELARNEVITYEVLAEFLGRTANAVKCRWHANLKKKVDLMPMTEYQKVVHDGERRWRALQQSMAAHLK